MCNTDVHFSGILFYFFLQRATIPPKSLSHKPMTKQEFSRAHDDDKGRKVLCKFDKNPFRNVERVGTEVCFTVLMKPRAIILPKIAKQ